MELFMSYLFSAPTSYVNYDYTLDFGECDLIVNKGTSKQTRK